MTDRRSLDGIAAVVLTHRRPRLATRTVTMLIDDEGFDPADIVLVVNGDGGLDDPRLEASVDLVRLPTNRGPAGGFRAGLAHAAAQDRQWAYVCEDDICLLHLPRPAIPTMLQVAADAADRGFNVGAVVTYGRRLDRRTGRTHRYPLPPPGSIDPVIDCGAWGASLISCGAVESGALPDTDLFFGFEDFDFFLRLRRLGYDTILSSELYRSAVDQVSESGRAEQFGGERPADDQEPWRHYYFARNFLELRRRYGRRSWSVAHVVLSLRRWQLARWSTVVGRAIADGLADGFRGRLGVRSDYQRRTGELPPDPGR
jgi:hypothetical protein